MNRVCTYGLMVNWLALYVQDLSSNLAHGEVLQVAPQNVETGKPGTFGKMEQIMKA